MLLALVLVLVVVHHNHHHQHQCNQIPGAPPDLQVSSWHKGDAIREIGKTMFYDFPT
jgi:hypothetical protein